VQVVRALTELRRTVEEWRRAGARIGFVPTMGALHEGHLALVRLARARADRVVVSIYVNPTQFAPHEDFARYPRDEAGDLAKLRALAVDLAYLPAHEDMYAPDHASWVMVEGPSEGLCSLTRPHFFRGVATVVAKLFHRVRPHFAVFGEKDFQQLRVVERMVRDLDMDVEVVPHPVVREADGLALSSRNVYLSPDQRRVAPALYRTLVETARLLADGRPAAPELAAATDRLRAAGFDRVDYLELRESATLRPLERIGPAVRGRLLAAAWLGGTRLIDNVPVPPDAPGAG